MSIHPTAWISPQAKLGRHLTVGPFSVIEPDVEIGDGCHIGCHVVLKQGTVMGAGNQLHDGAVIGGAPQHVHASDPAGRVRIGEGNVFREHSTVHRSLSGTTATLIGDGNYFMAGSHVAHDCVVGNRVILANNVLLAGHVVVEDRAYLGGAVAVHQHCRVGRNVMVGGCAAIRQDVPPYVTVDGVSGLIVGLNLIGLNRAGYSRQEIDQLKAAYRRIYRSGLTWRDLVGTLRVEFPTGPAAVYAEFFSGGARGFVQERRSPPKATIKLHRDEELPVYPNKAVG